MAMANPGFAGKETGWQPAELLLSPGAGRVGEALPSPPPSTLCEHHGSIWGNFHCVPWLQNHSPLGKGF